MHKVLAELLHHRLDRVSPAFDCDPIHTQLLPACMSAGSNAAFRAWLLAACLVTALSATDLLYRKVSTRQVSTKSTRTEVSTARCSNLSGPNVMVSHNFKLGKLQANESHYN